jgi:2-polyprenyl-3-methyl-5-hydroxy-6-metoxy-1,4-benzoquinol methylase
VSETVRGPRMGAEQFERLYEASTDPWGYCSSPYEREKYADTLAALPARPLGRCLEVGCSIGVFTSALAPRCQQLVAIDFSARALALARNRLSGVTNVELQQASFPEQAPAGPWDVVVCSEVLYYLDEFTLRQAMSWLEQQLRAGTSVLVVSWRGEGRAEPLRGDEVHDLLAAEWARWHALGARHAGYRLDRFDSDAR